MAAPRAEGIGAVHVVGAGLSGLAAAFSLSKAGVQVELHEQAPFAGGRCRSWEDAQLGERIDNGNHLLLSANSAALDFLREAGNEAGLRQGAEARFAFCDLRRGERFGLELGDGSLPTWLLRASGRVPGTGLSDYLGLWRLLFPKPGAVVADCLPPDHPLFRPLVEPLCLAVMNAGPEEASAASFATVLRATLLRGGAACRPLLTREGLGPCFIDPALAELARRGAGVHMNRRLTGIERVDGRPRRLLFGQTSVDLAAGDALVLALPPANAAALLPGLQVPEDSRPILNLHFRLPEAAGEGDAPIIGLLGGRAQWIFRRGVLASVTVSNAGALIERDAESLTAEIWPEVAAALGLSGDAPPCRVVKEKRATFAQTPGAQDLRPAPDAVEGLWLAGDWTATGLPATIEGAIRSGREAARCLLESRA